MRRYHLVRRADSRIGRTIAFYAVGILVSLLIGAVILFALGINPLDYYGKMFTIGLVGRSPLRSSHSTARECLIS